MAPIEDVPGRDRTLASRQPRSSRVEDLAQAAGEVALSVIPVVGSALQTTFASAANIVSTRRTEAWLAELATEVDRLAARKSLSVTEIVEDPAFFESLVRGTRSAQATTRTKKLDALRSIILNSGSWSPTSALVQQTCLRLVDQLEAEHLALLEIFAHPDQWLANHPELGDGETITFGEVVPAIISIPGEGAADWMAMRFLDELHQRGLISQSVGLAYQIKRVRTIDTNVTPLGTALIEMITAPSFRD